jgi:hypothetical protein
LFGGCGTLRISETEEWFLDSTEYNQYKEVLLQKVPLRKKQLTNTEFPTHNRKHEKRRSDTENEHLTNTEYRKAQLSPPQQS